MDEVERHEACTHVCKSCTKRYEAVDAKDYDACAKERDHYKYNFEALQKEHRKTSERLSHFDILWDYDK